MSVALSADGNTALIGDPGNNAGVGAAWAFTRSGQAWTQQGPKLTASGEIGDGFFGMHVALSADGNTALVGGPRDNGEVGAAWVFTRSGQTWTQQGSKLTGSGATGAGLFGWNVALSADGNTALVGGPADNGEVGAAWVFTRSGQTWAQQGPKLTGALETGAGRFGQSVALSADGNTALIGGPTDNPDGGLGGVGAAWVFTRSGQTWAQQGAKLTGASGPGGFGTGVALSTDGNTALVGGQHDDNARGSAWVFVRSGQTWAAQGPKLGPGGTSASSFGISVALSGDGNTALAGGFSDTLGLGAAWVFTRAAQTWTQQGPKLSIGQTAAASFGEIVAPKFGESVSMSADGTMALIGGPDDNAGVGAAWLVGRSGERWALEGPRLTGSGGSGAGKFGHSVALSADGTTALVGAPEDNGSVGAAWVFAFSGGSWVQQGPKLIGEGATGAAKFGHGVALSAGGNRAIVGGPADNGNAGAAWVFTRSGQTWTQQGSKLTGAGETGADQFGYAVALSADGATALIGGPFDGGGGAAWAFTRSGQTWTQQGSKLTGSGGVSSPAFGASVALSSDGNTALAGGPQDNLGAGAAWVFTRSGQTWAQQGSKLTGSGLCTQSQFGWSVALSGEGDSALIGGPDDGCAPEGVLPGTGAAWAFTRSDTTWTQLGSKIGEPSNATGFGSNFGSSVALSGDGRRALVGGPRDWGQLGNAPFTGAVWGFISRESPAITSAAAATFRTGQAGSFTVTTTGFPVAALSVDGALPAGVSFTDAGDGTATLAGTPAGGTAGVYRLTITAANGASADATQEFTLTVGQPPAITSAAARDVQDRAGRELHGHDQRLPGSRRCLRRARCRPA